MFRYGTGSTVEQITQVRCNKCGLTVCYNKARLTGCLCDPDAPTWIALDVTGRMLKMSHADYTIMETA